MTNVINNAGPKALTSKNTHPKSLEILKTRTGGKLLDAPSGQGVFAHNWVREGGTAVALDRNPGQNPLGLPQVIADLNRRLPFREHSFDAVSCIDGIEHLENPFQVIREFHRVLNPDGYLLISTPNIQETRSRVRFLFSGFYNKFKRPLDESRRSLSHHINPMTYPEIRYILRTSGFIVELLTVNRVKFQSMLYLPFLPFIKIYTWISLLMKEHNPTQKLVNREIFRDLTRISTLAGETLIILARKPE
jgi:SAM-dependent methyltransferase